MSDSIRPEHPAEVVRKSDIPWYCSSFFMQAAALTIPPLMLAIAFLDVDSHELRPGLLDGAVTGAIGIVFGWLAGRWSENGLGRALKEQFRNHSNFSPYGIHTHDFVVLGLFLAAMVCSATVGWILHEASIVWPMVGENPTFMAGCCGFVCSICYRYSRWYDNLPS